MGLINGTYVPTSLSLPISAANQKQDFVYNTTGIVLADTQVWITKQFGFGCQTIKITAGAAEDVNYSFDGGQNVSGTVGKGASVTLADLNFSSIAIQAAAAVATTADLHAWAK